jgi:Xaa-Pro aminopeptidase
MTSLVERRNRIRSQIKKMRANAMLISAPTNVGYLSGFTGEDSFLVIRQDGDVLVSDSRFVEQLKEECPGLDLHIRRVNQIQADGITDVLQRAKARRVLVEGNALTLAQHEALTSRLPKVEFIATTGIVEELRMIKDRGEIQAIQRAIEVAERAMQAVRAGILPDQTELQIAAELEYWIRKFGGQGCSFKPIVAVGPRAALPHAPPSSKRIEEHDFVLMDWGARVGRYVSDLTRVWVTARIPPKLERVYAIVAAAQHKAIDAIKPGVLAEDVDAAARTVIEQAGYGKYFGHGLGHGIGMDVHEAPRLAPSQARPLQAGMVITVEPGIYLPGFGGVRIEDDVLVTRDGHQVLSSIEKRFEHCRIP